MKVLRVMVLFFLLFIFGLNQTKSQSESLTLHSKNSNPDSKLNSYNYIDSIIAYGKTFIDKPYKYKGPSPWAMDCSGYLAFIYSRYGYQIPHSASAIGTIVENIDQNTIRKGDLMFFKGRNARSNSIGHVSLVIDVNDKVIKMLHSCRRGIIIDEYPTTEYYQKSFVKAGRLPFISSQLLFDSIEIKKSTPLSVENIEKQQDSVHASIMYDTLNIKRDTLSLNEKIKEKIDSLPEPVFPDSQTANKKALKDTIEIKPDTISIIGVGDMMLGTNYPSDSFLPLDDGKYLLAPVKDIIDSANIAFGNMEGVILSGEGYVKSCSNPDNCYAFKMPDHYVNYFKEAGFDILGIANNHVGDFGEPGRINTVKMLEQAEIKFAGLTNYPFTTFEKNGVKYGFCAFAPNTGTISINDGQNAIKIVQHLDSICDIVIVSFHGGAEGSGNRHITRSNEIFLGENRGNPYKFARDVIDAGADVVFGQGPHVTRAVDLYKDRFIAYSLGNFATYGRFNLTGVSGVAPIVKVYVNHKGEFLSGQIYSIKQIGEGGPVIDPYKKALKEIISLTFTDIPEAPINIDQNGLINKK
jgi:hypothetical protein